MMAFLRPFRLHESVFGLNDDALCLFYACMMLMVDVDDSLNWQKGGRQQ